MLPLFVFVILVHVAFGQQPPYSPSSSPNAVGQPNVQPQGTFGNVGAGGAYAPRLQPQPQVQSHAPRTRQTANVEQYGTRYQSSTFRAASQSPPAVARGVQQQPRAQPLPPALTSTPASNALAPLATATTPAAPIVAPSTLTYNVVPQQQPIPTNVQQLQQAQPQPQQQQQQTFFYPQNTVYSPQQPQQVQQQQFVQPTTFDANSYYAAYAQAQAQSNNPYATNQVNPYAQRETPVTHFDFKEGTLHTYCGYGVFPVPEYNTPRKRCVPWHPMCGIVFTCIMDV
ncbi:hypothetical protein M3Y99_01635700 [Aphelenchoides fujianensis]|nr:hypothetical protein M3Y99_01635700 [Aphelenchoides fujianensis]